jgi:hypothetical protein
LSIGDDLQRQRGAKAFVHILGGRRLACLKRTDRLFGLRHQAGGEVIAGQLAEQFVGAALEHGLNVDLVGQVIEDRLAGYGAVDDMAGHHGQFRAVVFLAVDNLLQQVAFGRKADLLEPLGQVPAGASGIAEAANMVEQGTDGLGSWVDAGPVVKNRMAIATVGFDTLYKGFYAHG